MSDSSIPPDPEIEELFLGSVTDDTFGNVDLTLPVEGTDTSTPTEGEELPPEQLVVEEPAPPIGDGSCHVCGAPTFRPPGLTKSGQKKRAPKYCDLHNPKLRVSGERSIPHGMDGEQQLKRIQEELADDIRLLGVMFGPLLPVTGVYVFENADPFTVALLKLCKNNPRALRVLHRAASVAPVYEVAKDVAGCAYAMQVDMKRVDAHTTIGQRLGVARAYDTVYPDTVQGNTNNVMTNGHTGPPRYAATN